MKKLIALIALVVAGTTGAVIAATDGPPPRPEWVGEDGVVDTTKLPEEFEVAGPDGESIVCANGKKLKVKTDDLVGPPDKPEKLGPVVNPTRDFVWRCGRGPDPDKHPRMVPAG